MCVLCGCLCHVKVGSGGEGRGCQVVKMVGIDILTIPWCLELPLHVSVCEGVKRKGDKSSV